MTLKINLFKVLLGTLLSAFGLSLMITSSLGVDTLSVALFGVMKIFPLKFGYLSLCFNLFVLMIAFLFDRRQIGIGSLINGIGIGLGVNFFTSFFTLNTSSIISQLVASISGVLLFALGIGIYVSAQLGAAALECLTLMVVNSSNFSIKTVRILIDSTMIVIGLLLGNANLGIGTLLCVCTTGVIMEGVLKFQSRLIKNKKIDAG
ncbi:YczE/YyaS/YitT family protein [Candidatus Enterococcus murrayae]|uniref:YitT family protein n=1 Tax=Candidatus Enterococcus murrayae TaxID=2815321 RepID=A0ABS3HF88_9ENTE|nr:YitT family protein [Enterococcus sp. MJM16]MBO0451590.1 YitT family protein [Enterococcus sp. MJM16]